MSRVIFPPFQHKSGVTELDHALDAKAIDAAFNELANALNGGIDESNLSAGVKFSTVSPGAPSVNTAIAAKYAPVAMSVSGVERLSQSFIAGTVIGSGWIPWKATALYSRSVPMVLSLFNVYKKSAGVSTSIKASSTATRWQDGSVYYESAIATLNSTVADGDIIFIDLYNGANPLTVHAASVTFLVPVL